MNKFPSDKYQIYEITRNKIAEPVINTNIEFVSEIEQKQIEKELEDPDCNIIASTETIEI